MDSYNEEDEDEAGYSFYKSFTYRFLGEVILGIIQEFDHIFLFITINLKEVIIVGTHDFQLGFNLKFNLEKFIFF